MGNREFVECSNRGVCDRATGLCNCRLYDATNPWGSSNGAGGAVAVGAGTRGDCGYTSGTVTTCPSSSTSEVCSGHGTCSGSPTWTCSCNSGYEGGDCSLFACPTGTAWYDEASSANTAHASGAVCSNRGICDATAGTCTCDTAFTGAACERLGCPTSTDGTACQNNGVCSSMSQLATYPSING